MHWTLAGEGRSGGTHQLVILSLQTPQVTLYASVELPCTATATCFLKSRHRRRYNRQGCTIIQSANPSEYEAETESARLLTICSFVPCRKPFNLDPWDKQWEWLLEKQVLSEDQEELEADPKNPKNTKKPRMKHYLQVWHLPEVKLHQALAKWELRDPIAWVFMTLPRQQLTRV